MDAFQECKWWTHRTLWEKGCFGGIAFLEAGQVSHSGDWLSVSPVLEKNTGDGEEEDGDSEGEVEGDMEGEEGERLRLPKEEEVVKQLRDPKLPSREDVERHYLMGHVLFRDWCLVCVKAQGKEMDHSRDKGRARNLTEYSWDYCFPGDELGFKWTVLVGKERQSKSWMAQAVPTKGVGSGRFIVDRCLDFVKENGDSERDIIVKTDQEPAM